MKIIWAIPTFEYPQTGGEKAFTCLAELLESKGVHLIKTYRGNEERSGIGKQLRINFHNFKILFRQDKKASIFQNILNRPEFLLANLLLTIIFRRKIILFIHEVHEVNHHPFIQRWYHSFINYLSFRISRLIVVNSHYTRNWVWSFGDFKNKIFLMYPVVESLDVNSRGRKKSQNGPVRILCVGNIRRNKGQMHLVQAMEYIKHDFEITFVGLVKEKEYMDQLQEYILTKEISDKIRFTGFLTGQELSEKYEKADIFVSPTLKEGFGLAVLEAMSYGLAVIASNVGAIPEIIEDRLSGLLVELKNSESLAGAILEMLENPTFKERLQENAIKRCLQFKTIDEQFEQFYETGRNLC